MSVMNRANTPVEKMQTPVVVRGDVRDAAEFVLPSMSVVWETPARAIGDARVAAWLRETLANAYETASVQIRWHAASGEASELMVAIASSRDGEVRGVEKSLRIGAFAPARVECDSRMGCTLVHVHVDTSLAMTLVKSARGELRLLFARTSAMSELGVAGGRYEVVEVL
jgi:hypothetical protein